MRQSPGSSSLLHNCRIPRITRRAPNESFKSSASHQDPGTCSASAKTKSPFCEEQLHQNIQSGKSFGCQYQSNRPALKIDQGTEPWRGEMICFCHQVTTNLCKARKKACNSHPVRLLPAHYLCQSSANTNLIQHIQTYQEPLNRKSYHSRKSLCLKTCGLP